MGLRCWGWGFMGLRLRGLRVWVFMGSWFRGFGFGSLWVYVGLGASGFKVWGFRGSGCSGAWGSRA